MKKITTGFLLIIFLFGMATFAYAETSSSSVNDTGQRRAVLQAKMQNMSDLKAQLKPQIEEIRQNRTETLQLRADARLSHKAAFQHIKELKKNPDQLTEAQITALKQARETLKQIKLALAETKGDVRTEVQALKKARQQKDTEAIKASLDNIITVQHERMELIQNSINEMNKIQEI